MKYSKWMSKRNIDMVFGFLFLAEGTLVSYVYIQGMDNGISPLFLAFAIPVMVAGALLLLRARKNTRAPKQEKSVAPEVLVVDTTHEENILEQNNKIINEWQKIYQTREKLKTFKVAAASMEEEVKQ